MLELGKIIHCEQGRGNPEDSYAIGVMKDDTIAGHIPCKNHM